MVSETTFCNIAPVFRNLGAALPMITKQERSGEQEKKLQVLFFSWHADQWSLKTVGKVLASLHISISERKCPSVCTVCIACLNIRCKFWPLGWQMTQHKKISRDKLSRVKWYSGHRILNWDVRTSVLNPCSDSKFPMSYSLAYFRGIRKDQLDKKLIAFFGNKQAILYPPHAKDTSYKV